VATCSRNRFRWRFALILLTLVATVTLQLAAATHWHPAAASVSADSTPAAPAGDQNDGCLLCQAAHLSASAPPPAQWALFEAPRASLHINDAVQCGAGIPLPSHAWQGRAPPRV